MTWERRQSESGGMVNWSKVEIGASFEGEVVGVETISEERAKFGRAYDVLVLKTETGEIVRLPETVALKDFFAELKQEDSTVGRAKITLVGSVAMGDGKKSMHDFTIDVEPKLA